TAVLRWFSMRRLAPPFLADWFTKTACTTTAPGSVSYVSQRSPISCVDERAIISTGGYTESLGHLGHQDTAAGHRRGNALSLLAKPPQRHLTQVRTAIESRP